MKIPATQDWFNEAMAAFSAHVPEGHHYIVLVSNDGGAGIASCCPVEADRTWMLLERARDIVAAERMKVDADGNPYDSIWAQEAEIHGTH